MPNHGPKPLVEEHYHIRELIDRQDARVKDRNRHDEIKKEKGNRDDIIRDAKTVDRKEFFCSKCRKDFMGVAQLQVEEDWNGEDRRSAFYKTKCFCGKWCVRLVTDRERDPYWRESVAVKMDRTAGANDLLQPFEEGYNLLYGKK